MKRNLVILFIILGYRSIKANDTIQKFPEYLLPDHIKIQFAGNIGFFSAGLGYEFFNNRLSSDILVGYVPTTITDETIINIVFKNTVRLFNLNRRNPDRMFTTFSFSTNFETGNNSFFILPDKYPDGYYSTKAITFGLNLGFVYRGNYKERKFFRQFEYYAEAGTLATYLYYNIKRKDYLNPDIFSLALGINIKI